MVASINITGKTYGKLTAIRFSKTKAVWKKTRQRFIFLEMWVFRCQCGTEKTIWKHSVMTGNTSTCGSKECRRKPKDIVAEREQRKKKWAWLLTLPSRDGFSPRQNQVIDYLILGYRQDDIAQALDITQFSVCKAINGNIEYPSKRRSGGILHKIDKCTARPELWNHKYGEPMQPKHPRTNNGASMSVRMTVAMFDTIQAMVMQDRSYRNQSDLVVKAITYWLSTQHNQTPVNTPPDQTQAHPREGETTTDAMNELRGNK